MMRYSFLIESYRTERLKTLSVWSQVPDDRMTYRPEPRARTPHEQMVHQCVSEDTWMRNMLGITVSLPALPATESRLQFLEHYGSVSGERLEQLQAKPDRWFEADTTFFDVVRTRAWVLTRRLTHTAHHRGQLTVYLRLWGQACNPRTALPRIPVDCFNTTRRSFIDTHPLKPCSRLNWRAGTIRLFRDQAITIRLRDPEP